MNEKLEKNVFPKNVIGQRLRIVRTSLGLTLELMRMETGISKSYISDFERGKKTPSSKYLFHLSHKFNVSLDYIFKGIGTPFVSADSGMISKYQFGRYEPEIVDLLEHISSVPSVLFAVLEFFTEYKEHKSEFISEYIDKYGHGNKND